MATDEGFSQPGSNTRRLLRRSSVSWGGKLVAVDDDAALRSLHAALELEPRDARSLVEQLVLGHLVESKELPPVDLVFASMPLEELREDPLRLLDPVPLEREVRGRAPRTPRECAPGAPRASRFGLAERRGGSRDGLTPIASPLPDAASRASRAAPSAETQSSRLYERTASRISGGQRGRVPPRDRVLDGAQVPRHLPKIDLAREAVERLELLDGVAVDAGAQRLPHDAVEVDEDLRAQELVELVGPRRRTSP